MLTFTLSACASLYKNQTIIANRDTAYLKARTGTPLRIPAGLSSDSIHEDYPIPEKPYPKSSQTVNLTPPELNTITTTTIK